jgi:hypothetical protein
LHCATRSVRGIVHISDLNSSVVAFAMFSIAGNIINRY